MIFSLNAFDLLADPKEEINLADQNTSLVNQMEDNLTEAHTTAKIKKFKIKSLDEY